MALRKLAGLTGFQGALCACRTNSLGGTRPYASTSLSDSPVYIVFGASGGVGSSLVETLLAQKGASVVAAADDESGLKRFQDGDRSLALSCNVIDPDSVASVVEQAHSRFGHVTGVANCVGNMVLKPAHLTSLKEFRSSLDMNLVSAFNVIKGSVEHMMKNGGGSIALCSAAVALRGVANIEAIAAAKGGVASLSQAAAATYAEHGIRVNCVAPGVVDTPMTEQLTKPEGARQDTEGMLPLHNKITSPRDVAAALEFLLSPSNSMITGALLTVDGGMSVSSPR